MDTFTFEAGKRYTFITTGGAFDMLCTRARTATEAAHFLANPPHPILTYPHGEGCIFFE